MPRLAGERPERRLALFAALGALAVPPMLFVLARVPFHPFDLRKDPLHQIPAMLAIYVAVTVPSSWLGSASRSHCAPFRSAWAGSTASICWGRVWGACSSFPPSGSCPRPGAVIVASVLLGFAAIAFAARAAFGP